MELGEALEQIHVIRAQFARTEVFRGYKAVTVGCTGALAILAAAIQPIFVPDPLDNTHAYLQLWIGVAAISAIWVAIELTTRWVKSDSSLQREQTLSAVGQFLPCLVAGAAMTWAVVTFSLDAAHILPGLWSILFGLGIFASCRQMPRHMGIVGAYYLFAGVTCLAIVRGAHSFHPLAMAGTFGVGQILTAVILYLALERRHAER